MPGEKIHGELYPVLLMDEADYVRIRTTVQGCRVTAGAVYKLHRNYNHPQLFVQGEVYVLDDDFRENYAVLLVCGATFYRLQKPSTS